MLMARKKEYSESEVVEKAMHLFWKHGFECTSMQMLEKEMGINKFSIYSSFGNKDGVLIESLKCYKQKLNQLIEKLHASQNGIAGIKAYFYDFVPFSQENDSSKGCLITNITNELSADTDERIRALLQEYTSDVRDAFLMNLSQESTDSSVELSKQADYLLIAMFGLSSACKVFSKTQVENYIEQVFAKKQ